MGASRDWHPMHNQPAGLRGRQARRRARTRQPGRCRRGYPILVTGLIGKACPCSQANGSGILSVFAARAGAARVYAVERTSAAVLAQELAAANGAAEIVQVIHGDVMDVEPPERVDVVVSEWLGGFGIDEGMLVPVIAARDRWLKPGGVMIPRLVMAWAALVHDRHLAEMVEFLRDNPYGLSVR